MINPWQHTANLEAGKVDLSQQSMSSGLAASIYHLTGLHLGSFEASSSSSSANSKRLASDVPSKTEILAQQKSAAQLTTEAKVEKLPLRALPHEHTRFTVSDSLSGSLPYVRALWRVNLLTR